MSGEISALGDSTRRAPPQSRECDTKVAIRELGDSLNLAIATLKAAGGPISFLAALIAIRLRRQRELLLAVWQAYICHMATTLTAFDVLGGSRALGSAPTSDIDLISIVRHGIPYRAVEKVAAFLEISIDELAGVLGLKRRTLARRKDERRLSAMESERILRLARAAGRAVEVLGDVSAAREWLRTPNRALEGMAPRELLDTDIGAGAVMDVLGRIEHGVYG